MGRVPVIIGLALATVAMLANSSVVQVDEARPTVCTVGGVAVPDGEPLPQSIPAVISCFDSEAAAEQFIADGAPGDAEQLIAAVGHRVSPLSATGTVTIGKAWTGTSRTGSELVHWGVGTGCYGVTYGFPSLSAGWNNAIQSAEGVSNCWTSQYDLTSYGGEALLCRPYCASLSGMNKRTSSIVYRPVGTYG